jgi:hypothetical protein
VPISGPRLGPVKGRCLLVIRLPEGDARVLGVCRPPCAREAGKLAGWMMCLEGSVIDAEGRARVWRCAVAVSAVARGGGFGDLRPDNQTPDRADLGRRLKIVQGTTAYRVSLPAELGFCWSAQRWGVFAS